MPKGDYPLRFFLTVRFSEAFRSDPICNIHLKRIGMVRTVFNKIY